MSFALQECFAEPLHDLGEGEPRLRGIFTPASERGLAVTGVTAQFLDDAGEYHKRYDNVEGCRAVIARLLSGGPSDAAGVRFILDVGSGSGNSVIPVLDLYPDAFVVATDISPQLLLILRDFLESKPAYQGRYGLVCMDANNDRFRHGTFDLAVGAAILHHIVDPRRVLRVCANALRPCGKALFIEPFEVGHGVLRIAYRRILAEAKRRHERGPGFRMLERMIVDHEARLRDKCDPIFERLDDKWYFTRSFFEAAVASDSQWKGCHVEAINHSETPLVDHALGELRLGLGADASALPPWAWDIIGEHEAFFSRDGRRDMVFEAAVVLRRSEIAELPAAAARRSGWWWNSGEPGRGFFIEFSAGTARVACCAYDDDGNPTWSVAGQEALDLSGASETTALSVCGASVSLEPQHADLASGRKTGWWAEDAEASLASIVVEDLGNRVMAAMLAHDGWSLLVGSQRGPRSHEGEWLRFTGGQTLAGPYRAPSPRVLGPGSLAWTDDECLIALGPDARRRVYRRLAPGAAVPQNLRSTEKCAS